MTHAARPVIAAIDFDGVVNALPRTEDDLAHFDRWDQRVVNGFPLTVAGEVLDWLAGFPERGAEFHWATTWTPHRHLLDEAFGLPGDAPVAADPDRRDPVGDLAVSWKGTQVMEVVAATRRPLVWIDDDAITEGTVAALEDLAVEHGVSMLGVCPNPHTGLVPREMNAVDAFLAAVRDGTARPGLRVRRGR